MRQALGGLVCLAMALSSVGCDPADGDEQAELGGALGDDAEAVSISQQAGGFAIEAPGAFNHFNLTLGWSYLDAEGNYGGVSIPVYQVAPAASCDNCLLPGTIQLGQGIEDFLVQACLATPEAEETCQLSEQIEGLRLTDLLLPITTPEGQPMELSSVHATFTRSYERWDDAVDYDGELVPFPRVDTAQVELELQSDGSLVPVSAWVFQEDALNAQP